MRNITITRFLITGITPLLILCIMLLSHTSYAQQPAANLDQTRNGPPATPVNPGDWVNGNVGAQTAHFIEGYSIPYRCIMTNLPTDGTVVSIIFEYDTKHSGKHAIDFITHYDNIEPHNSVFGHNGEIIDPLIGFPLVPSTPITWPIPTPPTTNTPVAGEPTTTFGALTNDLKLMTLFGGNYSGATPITYVLSEDLTLSTASVQFQIDFVPTNETAILAWGGHIGMEPTWGTGNSAVGINGSPYHMRLIDWNLNNLGNQDRSCNAAAVYSPPPCDFTGTDNLCANTEGTYSLDVTDPAWTYTWTITQNGTNAFFVGGNTSSSVQVNSGTLTGAFTLTVEVVNMDNGFPVTSQCEMEINVNPEPPCTISGDFSICPSSTATYSGPTSGVTSYAWSISGDASITGFSNGQTVDVLTILACPGSFELTLTTTNADGCTSTCNQIVIVNDDTPPAISGVGQDMFIECPNVPVFSTPTVTDNCDSNPTFTFADVTTDGVCANEYMVTRTWTATDACSNTATASQTVTVEDNTPPTISGVGADMVIECPSEPAFSNPTASDLCDDNPILTFSDVTTDGVCANEYMVTRTWTATDACGNTATASQTITVEDNTPPTISGVGADMVIECPNDPVFSTPTASDLCDDNPTLTFNDVVTEGECINNYTITRTWTSTDVCGNTATASQSITIYDNTPPEISGVGDNFAVECPTVPEFSSPGATDLCGGEVVITFEDVTTPGDCGNEYTITRTWTATDACGNTATASQSIAVEDNTPPEITGIGPDETIDCSSPLVFSEPVITDNCDESVQMLFEDVFTAGACDEEYSVMRTWTAIDDCGNIATASQLINVVDNTPLTLTNLPEDVNAECGEDIILPYPEAVDACGDDAVVEFSRSDGGDWGDPFDPGTSTQVCFWAYDGCGNFSETVCIDVTVEPCGDAYCTLTQGFYGNAGGTYCSGQGTADLIDSLLSFGNLTVGYGGNTMTFYPGNSTCIIDLLPGGGPSKTISGMNTCASYPGIQIKKGNIFNSLLAQTITMGLNLRLSDNLGSLLMLSDTLLTAPSSGCGEPGDSVIGDYTKYAIPQQVWNELSQNGTITPSINDLYDLANRALGGEAVSSPLGKITNAVDIINVAFDECRIGYFEELVQLFSQPTSPSGSSGSVADMEALIELSAYPNPFREVATIQFSVPVSTMATLEVYTLTGMKVQTIFDGQVEGGVVYTHQYFVKSHMSQSTLIYIIKTSYGAKYGKLLLLK